MTDPRELPQQVSDLIELSKQYLRQETLDPLRRVAQLVALAVAAGLLVSLGAVLLAMGFHGLLVDALPEGQWWEPAAAAIVAVVFCLAAVMVAGRLRSSDE